MTLICFCKRIICHIIIRETSVANFGLFLVGFDAPSMPRNAKRSREGVDGVDPASHKAERLTKDDILHVEDSHMDTCGSLSDSASENVSIPSLFEYDDLHESIKNHGIFHIFTDITIDTKW